MPAHLAIVAYRSLIDGISEGGLDFQVRWFDENDETVIREQIEAEPLSCYENPYGQTVTWELVQIFTIERFEPQQSGDEVIGFIANIDELQDLTS